MDTYKTIIKLIAKTEALISGIVLGAMVFFNFMEIVSRSLFSHSFFWVQELSVILVCYLVYLGTAYVYCESNLLNVDLLFSKAKGTTRLIWEIVLNILMLGILAIIIIAGVNFTAVQNQAVSTSLHVHNSIFTFPLIICACTMLLKIVDKMYEAFKEYGYYKTNGSYRED